ncbi:MAG: FtsX-like permease family protein [Nitrososphaerota archaeon]|nr:FtsX-like permease family protein [Nitrososphaerota archaeon]
MTKRPWRSFFTIFMLMVALMLMTGTSIASNNIPALVESSLEEARMADFTVDTIPLSTSILHSIIGRKDYVDEYEMRLVMRTTAFNVKGWPESTDILLIGVNSPLKLNRVSVVSGRLFEEDEEALVVEHDLGENVLGRNLLVKTLAGNVTLKVVGTCRAVWMPRWYASSIAYALVHIKVLQRIMSLDGCANQVLVKIKGGYSTVDCMNDIRIGLQAYGAVSTSIQGQVIPFIETRTYYNYLVSLFSLIGVSLLAVSLALMYCSLNLMVTQEYRDLGTLRALGANRRDIVTAYMLRGLLLGALGSISGVFLGVIAARTLLSGFASVSQIFEGASYFVGFLPEIIGQNAEMLVAYIVLGTSLSLLLVMPPAAIASNIPPSQAMKSFSGLLAMSGRSNPRTSRGPLFMRYALRSLARRKGREAAIVIVIAVSVAVNSTLLAASEAQQNLLNETIAALNFDYIICLNRRFNATLLGTDLEPFLNEAEFIEFAYYTNMRAAGYTVFAIGMPVGATYFNYPLVEGGRFTGEMCEVILTESLAKIIGARVNGNLTFSTDIRSANLTVIGIRRDPIFNVLVLPLPTAQMLDSAEGSVNAFVIKAKAGVDSSRLIQNIRRSVRGYLWHIDRAGIINILSDLLTEAFQSTATVMITFTWITSVLLIFSIAGQNINEERMVIAILRALGLSRGKCIILIAFKLLVLGVVSAVLCGVLTPLILKVFSDLLASTLQLRIPLYLSPGILVNSAIFILVTTLPSGLILGVYAASLNIVSTLRYE